MDEDWGPNADDFIGQFSASLDSIMPGMIYTVQYNMYVEVHTHTAHTHAIYVGYRHIHLSCSGSPLENASLFVHVSIMDYIGPVAKSSKPGFKTRKTRQVHVCVCVCMCVCVCVPYTALYSYSYRIQYQYYVFIVYLI